MKSLCSLPVLILLSFGLSVAQNKPSSTTSTTRTTSTTVTPTSTNRQQELYDEYHGITKKPVTTTTAPVVTATPASAQPKPQRPASAPISAQPAEVASRPQRESMGTSLSSTRIGIRGGVTYPVFTETQVGIDPAIGFVGGLTFNFGAGMISFQPEVNYTRYSTKVTEFGFTAKAAVDALEVPLFLKISSGTYAGNRFFLNVGPYATYAMSRSEDGKKISLDGTKGRFGFGAGAGVGAALKAGPGHVTIEVRGLYPLGDVDNGFNTDSRTIFGQGTLGYIFPLGSR